MFVSPGLAPDSLLEQLPPIRVAVGSFDPLLDDSVEFTRRCVCDASILGASFSRLGCLSLFGCDRVRALGVDVQLHIHEALPHGFLSVQLLLPQVCLFLSLFLFLSMTDVWVAECGSDGTFLHHPGRIDGGRRGPCDATIYPCSDGSHAA
jgi:hypothetical protein